MLKSEFMAELNERNFKNLKQIPEQFGIWREGYRKYFRSDGTDASDWPRATRRWPMNTGAIEIE